MELTMITFVETAPSPQLFLPKTVISPDTAEVPKETVMLLVVLDPEAPEGRVHT